MLKIHFTLGMNSYRSIRLLNGRAEQKKKSFGFITVKKLLAFLANYASMRVSYIINIVSCTTIYS